MGLTTLGCMSLFVCVPSWLTDGILVGECPDGDVIPTLNAYVSGAGRGSEGYVVVSATGHYTNDRADVDRQAPIRRFSAKLALVDSKGAETPIEPIDGWDEGGDHQRTCSIRLPEVPDGDYLLRVRGDTAAGDASVDVPLGLYAPARVHLITDRPLYEPGNTVQFRALALRARDLSPLEKRPGTWTVLNPSGDVLLEEKAASGDWGVVAGSFPLDSEAASGQWTVRWSSGADTGEAQFTVEPFTLPRFRVEAHSDRASWFIGDQPDLRGRVVYSSGAPVTGAKLEISWSVGGGWPPPTRWMEAGSPGALPTSASTDANGDFSLDLPVVPADLQGKVTLSARITATDPAGDRVAGAASLLLAQDRIDVGVVTELDSGLVEGFNNRLYLRVTTAAGAPMSSTEVRVQRAWDPTDQGRVVKTDEDGVASLQIDPGPAVNVVVPASPYRPPPPPRPVDRQSASELFSGDSPALADVIALDGWNARLAPCARWVDSGSENQTLIARVSSSGALQVIPTGDGGLQGCMAAALAGVRMPAGAERLYRTEWVFRAQNLPSVSADLNVVTGEGDGLNEALGRGEHQARACLPSDVEDATLPSLLEISAGRRDHRVHTRWVRDPDGGELSGAAAACVTRSLEAALSGDLFEDPTGDADLLAWARVSVSAAGSAGQDAAPQPTVMLGYELRVTALGEGGEESGSTLLRMHPGSVPPLRMRATPVLAKAGDDVEVDLLRGPGFTEEIPEKLIMSSSSFPNIESKVDKKKLSAHFALPDNAEGWFTVSWDGAETRVFVQPDDDLSVELKPDRSSYAPGQTARLDIQTRAGDKPVAAGVGLIGVDESLSQLVTLPGADALDPLRPVATTPDPAFGVIDGAALSMGRVRGSNAAEAAILRVNAVPTPPELDAVVTSNASGSFSPAEPLADGFYAALAELHARTRAWEESAQPDEQMSPQKMADLWDEALDALDDRDQGVHDAYGRRLKLSRLPPELLALTDPRAVVLDSTHLPEDVEDWALWVAREQP